jgi:hypothetical protein
MASASSCRGAGELVRRGSRPDRGRITRVELIACADCGEFVGLISKCKGFFCKMVNSSKHFSTAQLFSGRREYNFFTSLELIWYIKLNQCIFLLHSAKLRCIILLYTSNFHHGKYNSLSKKNIFVRHEKIS